MKKNTKYFLLVLIALIVLCYAGTRKETTESIPEPQAEISDQKTEYVIEDDDGDVEPSSLGSRYKYYYFTLTKREQKAYNQILSRIYSMPEEIRIPGIDTDEAGNVFEALLYDNPDLFFVGRKSELHKKFYVTYFCAEYTISKEEYAAMKPELDVKIDSVLSLIDTESEWDREKQVHDYIIDHCDYNYTDGEYLQSTPYGCLINGRASCEGYAKATKMLLDKLGIESYLITGEADNRTGEITTHMWNIVKVNGNYYHLDTTWDDPVVDRGTRTRNYSYFNISDDMISSTHFNFSMDLSCSDNSEYYYNKNGLKIENYTRSNEDELTEAFVENIRKGDYTLQVYFVNEQSYSNAVKDLLENSRLNEIVRKVSERTGQALPGSISYTEDKDNYIFTVNWK